MKEHKVKLTIPTDWNDITVRMYQKFIKLDPKKLSEEKMSTKMVSILCDIKEEKIKYMEAKSLRDVAKYLLKLTAKKPDIKTLIKKVEWNGKKYGIIPNLSEITLGEYVDIETFCKDSNKNLHKIMSVLYRPIVKETSTRYSIEDYNPDEFKSDEYLEFPMLPAISSLSFFFLLGERLKKDLAKYLILQSQKKIQKIKHKQQAYLRNGVGTI